MNKQNLYFLLIAISLTSLLTVADNAIAENPVKIWQGTERKNH